MTVALLQFGCSWTLIDELALFKAMQRTGAKKPLADIEIPEGILRSKRKRFSRR